MPNQDNADRLQANRYKTEEVVQKYLAEGGDLKDVKESVKIKLGAALGLILDVIDLKGKSYYDVKGFYSKAVASLKEASDNAYGIGWHIGQKHADGTQDLIRDGRDAIEQQGASRISFLMQNVSVARAAELLLDQAVSLGASEDEVSALRGKIRADALSALQNGDKADEKTTKKLNSKIAGYLESLGVMPNVLANLNVAKEMVGFDDPHYHITSLSTVVDSHGKDRTVIESDIMNLGFTDEQKSQYQQIKLAADYGDIEGLDWYNQLDPVKRRLVKDNVGKVMSGKYVLQTQLREVLIGARNSYTKFVSMDGEMILETMHSATPSFHGKGDNLPITVENMKQLQSFNRKEVSFGSLNSSNGAVFGDVTETEITEQLEAASKSLKAQYTLSPLNLLRLLGSRTTQKVYQGVLTGLAKEIKLSPSAKKLAPVSDFLELGEKRFLYFFKTTERSKAALAALNGLGEVEAKLLRQTIEAKSLMEHKFWSFEHANLAIVSKMRNVMHSLTKQIENTFCKSGKDRTGVAEFKTTEDAVFSHLNLTDKKPRSEASNSLSRTQHVSFLATGQGGTTGSRGIRESIKYRVPEKYNNMKGLPQITAEFSAVKIKKSASVKKAPTPRSSGRTAG